MTGSLDGGREVGVGKSSHTDYTEDQHGDDQSDEDTGFHIEVFVEV